MTRIIHLSDLHFGCVDEAVVEALATAVPRLRPELTVVSGDLTQRAKPRQFHAAKAFLDRLPQPVLSVPGNHDVPLYNVWERFFSPFRRFQRYITNDPLPVYCDRNVGVVGACSAHAFTIAEGRLGGAKLQRIAEATCRFPKSAVPILVMHHPLTETLPTLAAVGIKVVLSGHMHVSSTIVSVAGIVLIGAGTATSTRRRGDDNSFNVLEIAEGRIALSQQHWRPEKSEFAESLRTEYRIPM